MKGSKWLAFALATVLLAGCAPAPAPSAPGGGSTPSVTPSATASGAGSASVTPTASAAPIAIRVYFARSEKMQAAPRTAAAGTKAVLRAALTALLAGPTKAEKAAGLSTAIPAGTTLKNVSMSGTLATIDLSSSFASGGGTLSMTDRLAQVVFTATQFPTVSAVTFKIEGKTITTLGGEGVMVEGPQARIHFESASPAILVEDPAWGATMRQSTIARGTADVFEAVFRLQLRDAHGTLLVDRTVHASSGTGTRGDWSEILTWTVGKPGPGTLKVFAQSAKDGSPVDVVTIPVVLAE